jgi:DNA (cytosine-5)-methyltransferase 1
MALDQVCLDLENQGYQVQPFIIPACAVNAPHRRDRVWIAAYRQGRERLQGHKNVSIVNGRETREEHSGDIVDASDTECDGFQGSIDNIGWEGKARVGRRFTNQAWDEDWPEVATRFCGMDARVPNRVDRFRALGNAIVPQVVMPIMEAIKHIEGGLNGTAK